MTTHAAAYTQSGRDTGRALCGDATGPVSTDWDQVDCEPCIRDHGFEQWHAGHRASVTAANTAARAQLGAAHRQIADAAVELAELREQVCEFDCDACLNPTDLGDAEALLAQAARLLRAASALTRTVAAPGEAKPGI